MNKNIACGAISEPLYGKGPWSKNTGNTKNPFTLIYRIIGRIQNSSAQPDLKSREHPSFPASFSFYSDTYARQLSAEAHQCPRNHLATQPAQYSAELRFDCT